MQTSVALILDPNFGDRLSGVDLEIAIWICGSVDNLTAATARRETVKKVGLTLSDPVTTFDWMPSVNAESRGIEILPAIEDHHRWSVLDVYGAICTDEFRKVLTKKFAAKEIDPTGFGFRARR